MGWVGRAIARLVILGVGAVIVVAVLIPRIGGATPYVVLTGSMQPHLPPGSLVVVRPVAAGELGIGDVITYQLHSGAAAVVTHRIVAMTNDADGQPLFRTKGDANSAADPKWVRPVQIRGERWYSITYLGYVTSVLSGQQRQLATYAVAAVLLGYAGLVFMEAARDRVPGRRKKEKTGG
jgi:signal peptidase I